MSGSAHELATLQRWFAHVMMHPGSVADGVRSSGATGADVTQPEQAARIVKPNARMSALQRIGVYHYAYSARLIECLADDYPALCYALGGEAFESLCRQYITRYPSTSPTLDAYGRHMIALCTEQGNAVAADLARLEWAIVEVIHAPAPAPLTLTTLALLDPRAFAQSRLVATPALRLLSLSHPVSAYYHAFRHEQAPVLPGATPSCVLVQRSGIQVFRRELPSTEAKVLRSLLDGVSVGSALAADGGSEPEAVSEWFQNWIGAGLFTALLPVGAD